MSKEKKTQDNATQEKEECACGCETNELKSIIEGEVSIYKAIWDEVQLQFSDAPEETRIKIYGSIAPYIGDMVTLSATECMEDAEEEKEDRKRKKKKNKN
jgi:hypothetical protein